MNPIINKIKNRLGEIDDLLNELEKEEKAKPEVQVEKLKCKDCIFLDLEKKCSIGCYCTAPKNWPHSVSAWKSPTAPACKTYFKRRKES